MPTLWALWGVYALAMLATLPSVPFHPDESTHIYLSQDFDQLVRRVDPAGVTWQAASAPAEVRRYRLLEAPLSRYLIGLSRTLTGQHTPPLAVDWNWSATWEANAAAGALPSEALLAAARVPATLGTVAGALLVFAIGRRAGGLVAGVSAAALYAANGALWLHGRRAMSEGLTIFAILLAVWVMLRWGRQAVAVGAARRHGGQAHGGHAAAGGAAGHRRQLWGRWRAPAAAALLLVSCAAGELAHNGAVGVTRCRAGSDGGGAPRAAR
jgi:hypothetical protein